jgi:hypothetical protein
MTSAEVSRHEFDAYRADECDRVAIEVYNQFEAADGASVLMITKATAFDKLSASVGVAVAAESPAVPRTTTEVLSELCTLKDLQKVLYQFHGILVEYARAEATPELLERILSEVGPLKSLRRERGELSEWNRLAIDYISRQGGPRSVNEPLPQTPPPGAVKEIRAALDEIMALRVDKSLYDSIRPVYENLLGASKIFMQEQDDLKETHTRLSQEMDGEGGLRSQLEEARLAFVTFAKGRRDFLGQDVIERISSNQGGAALVEYIKMALAQLEHLEERCSGLHTTKEELCEGLRLSITAREELLEDLGRWRGTCKAALERVMAQKAYIEELEREKKELRAFIDEIVEEG